MHKRRDHYYCNQIYLVMLRPTQLTKASFLQRNQMLQNGLQHLICAVSESHISKKHFATFDFCKNEAFVNCVGLNVTE